MKGKSESEVAQLCLTLSDPMDCSLPGSSIHGICQARVLEWGAIAFSVFPEQACFNFVLQSLSAVIFEPKKIKPATLSTCSPSILHEVMGLNAMILVF